MILSGNESTSAAPVSPPPVTICTRPSGAPAFAKMSPILRPTNGVSSDGLITTVFPAINAITTSPSGMLNG